MPGIISIIDVQRVTMMLNNNEIGDNESSDNEGNTIIITIIIMLLMKITGYTTPIRLTIQNVMMNSI